MTAVDTTVEKTEARPLEIAKYMSAGETRLAKSVVEAWGPGIDKRSATTAADTAVDTTVAKSIGDARPPRIAELSATTKSVLAESPGELCDGEVRPPGIAQKNPYSQNLLAIFKIKISANGTSSAAASAFVMPADETRPPEITECSAVQDTGWVKRWFNDRSFGFITLEEGAEDVYIHGEPAGRYQGAETAGHRVIRY